jgi:peptidoglycan/xylan/chitin deacetylase (PgdA/CDA1 family)
MKKKVILVIAVITVLLICTDVVYGVMTAHDRNAAPARQIERATAGQRDKPAEQNSAEASAAGVNPAGTPPAQETVMSPPPSLPSADIKTTQKIHRIPRHVPVLMYHSISDKPIGIKQLSVKPSDFEAQMAYLSDNGYTAIFFSELSRYKTLDKPVIVSFDDGYIDNYTAAYPILKKYGLKATVFMIAGKIDAPGYLSAEDMVKMKGLISFQSHTVTHPNLSQLGAKSLNKEFKDAKEAIARITNEPVYALAYPFGKFNSNVKTAASAYYDYAVTIEGGYFNDESSPYQIRRLNIVRSMPLQDFKKVVR